jgi:hypothetical protein
MRPMKHLATILIALALLASPAAAQPPGATGAGTPDSLVALVLERFATGTPAAFDSVFPEEDGRALVRRAAERKWPRRADGGRVVRVEPGRAVVLLGGWVEVGSSGDETYLGRSFSGLYEARRAGPRWVLARRLPLDSANAIAAHALHVELAPGEGMRVTDTLEVETRSLHGFAARINHRAEIAAVHVDGRAVPHAFHGDVLWIPAPRRGPMRLTVRYAMPVERDTSARVPGSFHPDHGHALNQYFWHPAFDLGSASDRARATVTVRAPAAFHVATSLPQSDTVIGGTRVVRGASEQPVQLVSLLYDREWRPVRRMVGGMRFEAFVTPGFTPSADSLAAELRRVHGVLSARFGAPPGRYFAVAQGRGFRDAGFLYSTNAMVVAGRSAGSALFSGPPDAHANFAHEVAHLWTAPTDPGRNWLQEGWAVFAEGVALGAALGPDAEDAFLERARVRYLANGFEGRLSLLRDGGQRFISYTKGPWVFHTLRQAIGDSAFDAGVRAYVGIPPGAPAGIAEFTAAMSSAAGRDVRPILRPWLEETTIPDVRARIDGDRVILTQHGPVFHLPLEVDLVTASGPARRRIDLDQPEDTLSAAGLGAVTDVVVDPDRRLLMRRRHGEVARGELRVPDAKEVALGGNFAPRPLPATRQGDAWTVEVPLSAGRYDWWWIVDGAVPRNGDGRPMTGERIVRARQPLEDAYPR